MIRDSANNRYISPFAVQAPSAIQFSPAYPVPQEMTSAKIEELKQAYTDAIERCKKAGFDFIEIHGAHVSRVATQRLNARALSLIAF